MSSVRLSVAGFLASALAVVAGAGEVLPDYRNARYLPAKGLIQADGESTHDYCHPNDYGAQQMGRVFAAKIREILGLEKKEEVR